MARASIVGAGMTKFGAHADVTLAELFAEAALPAFDDAGVAPDEVDALYFGNTSAAVSENDTHLRPKAAGQIGLSGVPTQRFEDACATSAAATKHAVAAIEAGMHDVVLVGGAERCTPASGLDTDEMTRVFASAASPVPRLRHLPVQALGVRRGELFRRHCRHPAGAAQQYRDAERAPLVDRR